MKKLFFIVLLAAGCFAQTADLDAERRALDAEKRALEAERRVLEVEKRVMEVDRKLDGGGGGIYRRGGFTSGERWGTFWLNWLIPGLGSGVIMKDVTGTWIQAGLYVGGWILVGNGFTTRSEYVYSYGYGSSSYGYYDTYTEPNAALYIGFACFTGNFVFNIARSSTYRKPGSTASGGGAPGEGFGFAVLPDKDGNLKGYALYSASF
jgi:hypothetical protein